MFLLFIRIPAPDITEKKIIGKRQKKHIGPEIFNTSITSNISPTINNLSVSNINSADVFADVKEEIMVVEMKSENDVDENDTILCTENTDDKNDEGYLVNVSTPDPFIFKDNILIFND